MNFLDRVDTAVLAVSGTSMFLLLLLIDNIGFKFVARQLVLWLESFLC